MVDKIEVQLSEAEERIGDKLHFLDRDMDGEREIYEIFEDTEERRGEGMIGGLSFCPRLT